MKKLLRTCASALALAAGIGMVATDAMATEGYFQHAYGLRHKALAGAGAASIEDATGISINPAGLVGIGDQFNMGISLFMPFRGFDASGPGLAIPGSYDSDKNVFPVPTLAYVRQLDSDSAIAFSIFGNGGMNTTYDGPIGPFGAGQAGVDLMQMFVSAAYARKLSDNFSIGIAPLFAIQRFKAYGLSSFAALSTDPTSLSDRGYDYSYGGGGRLGIMFKPTDTVSIGASYQTKMWMTRFKKYNGLFAEGGDFDIPANLQVGLAWQATPDFKVMLDYRRIFYSGVKSISNPGFCFSNPPASQLGGSDGCGFDWRDTNTIKLGLEYQATNNLILRAGYAYTFPNPVREQAVLFNSIAPGVIQHEITGGATYRVDEKNDIDFAFMVAPKTKVTGPQVNPFTGTAIPGTSITDHMYQFEVSLGWTYNFNGSSRAR